MKIQADRQLAELGVITHTVLATLHLLGLAYNIRRKNWFDCAMHGSSAVYDLWSAHRHAVDLRGLDD